MATLNSLISGGYEPDVDMDVMSDFDLWVADVESEAKEMSENKLFAARFDALLDGDEALASIYEWELKNRKLVIDVPPCSTLADEPYYQDDPDHEDRRKDWLENYAPDELPF